MTATTPMSNFSDSEISNKKLAAGLTGIFLGHLGIHKFILGYTTPGIIMIVVAYVGGFFTCGASWVVISIIGLIEGIIYLSKTNSEFEAMYLDSDKSWF